MDSVMICLRLRVGSGVILQHGETGNAGNGGGEVRWLRFKFLKLKSK